MSRRRRPPEPISIVAPVVRLAEWSVVRSRFVAVPETEVQALVERGWGIELRELVEVLEGAGAYHWEGWPRTAVAGS